jgi:hypothetical protein
MAGSDELAAPSDIEKPVWTGAVRQNELDKPDYANS